MRKGGLVAYKVLSSKFVSCFEMFQAVVLVFFCAHRVRKPSAASRRMVGAMLFVISD